MLNVEVCRARGSREREFAILASSSRGWSTESQDVSSGGGRIKKGSVFRFRFS